SLNSVGTGYDTLGDARKGLEYFEQALEMRRDLYKESHPDVAKSLNNVGMSYVIRGYHQIMHGYRSSDV
ncbi:unnamed protein product, partial [Didymodactylos carnosus]